MRTPSWKTVSTLVAMAMVATSCAESAVAPSAIAPSAPAAARLAPAGRPSLTISGQAPANTSADFTVGPSGGTFFVGNTAVVFPANSICDPATSSYGPGTWDDDCSPLAGSITIHAVTRASKGSSQVDFSPSLRFVKSNNPARWVWLFMYNQSAVGTSDLSRSNIYYAPTLDAPVVDESATDPRMRTYVDTRSGTVMRWVKHFSGFVVSTGLACDPLTSTDPTCLPDHNDGIATHP